LRQLLTRLRRLHTDESGQVVAFFVCGILVLFGFFALVLNTGVWYLDRRVAQNQADAAVLAGVQELPAVNTAAAREAAFDWLQKNGAARQSVCVVDGDYNHIDQGVAFADRIGGNDGLYDTIRVCVNRNTLIVFNEFFELAGVKIAAVAAAGHQEDPAPYAIFANHSCPHSDTLQMSGQSGEIFGRVHTNCILKVSGSNNDFNGGPVTYQESAPPTEWKGQGATPANENPPARDLPLPDPQTWNLVYPFALKSAGGVCDTITNGKLTLDNNTGVPDGVHCATGEIDVPANSQTATVTFISRDGPLKLSGNNLDFTSALVLPGGNPLLLFSYSANDDAIVISGQSAEWRGVLYAPRGGIVYSASNGVGPPGLFFSSIVGDRVSWSGSNYELHGITGQGGNGEIDLIE
jgi:hypothetical protein